MRATMMLCDHAEVAGGKLFINGGGWNETNAPGGPYGLALLIHVPWGLANTKQRLVVDLVTEDGEVVQLPSQLPVRAEIAIEVGRPVGTTPGREVVVPVAVNFPTVPLLPGRGYEWLLIVDGLVLDRVWFHTRP